MDAKTDERALQGIRVLDCCLHVAGPLGTMLLADLGADVIKVEPLGGEASRYRQGDESPFSTGFVASNRSKRSLAIDLRRPEGQRVLHRLVEDTDIFVTNFRPAARQKLSISFDELARVNPRLVYCSITGWGERSSAIDKPAFDTVAQARAGLLSVVMQDYESPMHMGMYVPDAVTGVYAMLASMAALRARDRTGVGQLVDTSLLQAGIFFLNANLTRWLDDERRGVEHRTTGLRSAGFVFRAGDSLPFALHIVPSPDKHWHGLTRAIEHPELADDPRFKSRSSREANYELLHDELRSVFTTRPRGEWFEVFDRHDIAHAPINDLSDIFEDEYVRQLDIVTTVELLDGTGLQVLNPPFRLSRTPARPSRPPLPGEHAEEILTELGFSAEEIADLQDSGTIAGP